VSDLAALAVALPLAASAFALFAGLARYRSGWYVALLALLGQLAVVGELARQVHTDGVIRYVVGGFEAPYGIELVVDEFTVAFAGLVALVGLGVLAYARRAGPHSNPFYATYLLLVAGLTGMCVTADLFNLYVFLEITGLAGYVLVASDDTGRSAVGALKYLLLGTVGASFFLLGVGYAFIGTGTLNMADLASQLGTGALPYDATLVRTAFVLITVGLFVKVAVFPLHVWQPTAYAGAPDSVSALISALVSTVSAYALLRVVYTVFTPEFLAANPFGRALLATAGAASIVVGSVLAVSQSEIKRTLAYSSVSQFGLVIAALSLANGSALTGAVIHLLGHAVMKGGLFLAAGYIATTTGARTVEEYAGLFERRGYATAAFAALAFGMVGVPPTVGFVGKWYIAVGAVEAGAWALLAVIVASTLLTLGYFLGLLERAFFREGPTPAPEPAADGGDGKGASAGMLAVVVLAAVLAVVLGALAFGLGTAIEPTVSRLLL
jgi:multicomponent Na+:H+ antiporter subunit D